MPAFRLSLQTTTFHCIPSSVFWQCDGEDGKAIQGRKRFQPEQDQREIMRENREKSRVTAAGLSQSVIKKRLTPVWEIIWD